MSKNVAEYFACDVFNDEVMKARLPKAVYKALTKTRKLGVPLDPTYADVVANALKDWAIEHGATHYTHWFQPMTGSTRKGRTGCIFFPVRRSACHQFGKRLYGLGSDFFLFCKGRFSVHPNCIRFLYRRNIG